jgi:large subunit ribosomal protein L4
MKQDVIDWTGKKVGTVDLNALIFGAEVRSDLMARTVRYQLLKRRAGTHKVKNRGEIARTGAKLYRQKGSGRARHGSARANLFRGGGRSFGPTPRDHSISLQKKVRRQALCSAMSDRFAQGQLVVLDNFSLEDVKTKVLEKYLKGLGIENALFVDGGEVDAGFERALSNLPKRHVVAAMGANVYDILRREKLVVSCRGIEALEARLS